MPSSYLSSPGEASFGSRFFVGFVDEVCDEPSCSQGYSSSSTKDCMSMDDFTVQRQVPPEGFAFRGPWFRSFSSDGVDMVARAEQKTSMLDSTPMIQLYRAFSV